MALVSVLKNANLAKKIFKNAADLYLKNEYYEVSFHNSLYLFKSVQYCVKSLHSSSKNNEANDLDVATVSSKQQSIFSDNEIIMEDSITSADVSWMKTSELDILEPCQEDVSDISTFTSPSFNLAAYVNKSRTLQELVKMGVDLNKIESRKGAAECILKLDFDKHIRNHLM